MSPEQKILNRDYWDKNSVTWEKALAESPISFSMKYDRKRGILIEFFPNVGLGEGSDYLDEEKGVRVINTDYLVIENSNDNYLIQGENGFCFLSEEIMSLVEVAVDRLCSDFHLKIVNRIPRQSLFGRQTLSVEYTLWVG